MIKKNLISVFAGTAVFIFMLNLSMAQTPATTGTNQDPVPQAPSPYPVPPSPVTTPNQVPQDPTIPKISIPINAPTDSIFKKTDTEDKPFKLQLSDTTHNSIPAPKD